MLEESNMNEIEIMDSGVNNRNIKFEEFISDDIWKKFGIDSLDHYYTESFENIDITPLKCEEEVHFSVSDKGINQISKLDAMWGGGSVYNSALVDDPLPPYSAWVSPYLVKPPPATMTTTIMQQQQQQQSVAPGRSLLIKPATRAQQTTVAATSVSSSSSSFPVIAGPDSPPISDDEDCGKPEALMKFLNDSVGDLDIDEDFLDYIASTEGDVMSDVEEEEEAEEDQDSNSESSSATSSPEPPQPIAPPKVAYAVNDEHSYHKDSMANLGLETPSDSEEEIDVVSIGEKNVMDYTMLPTNPSIQYQEHLEKTVQSAIKQKTDHHQQQQHKGCKVTTTANGIKIIPPVRKCTTPIVQHSQNIKKVPEPRAVNNNNKRGKNSNNNNRSQPYHPKKKPNFSDGENDLDKRNMHNDMERQRRVDLRKSFDELRMLVPKLEYLDRAAKVQILQGSKAYCEQLMQISEDLQDEKLYLQHRQNELRRRLSFLRRKLAATR